MGFSCSWSCGSPSFYRIEMRKAHKPHKCTECREPIPVGATHQYYVCKEDGSLFTSRTCERCADLRESYIAMGYCVYEGSLWEDHLEQLQESGADKNSKAVLLAKKILKIEEKEGEDRDN